MAEGKASNLTFNNQGLSCIAFVHIQNAAAAGLEDRLASGRSLISCSCREACRPAYKPPRPFI